MLLQARGLREKYKAYNRQISLYLKGEMIYDR